MKEHKNRLMKAIEQRYKKTLLNYDGNIHQKRQDSLWYGGSVIEFSHYRYIISLRAVGDVRCHLKNDVENYVVDKGNNGEFYHWAMDNGIRTDNQIDKNVSFGDNNWYEIWVYDTKRKTYVGNEFDCIWEDDIEAFVKTKTKELLKYLNV